MKLLDSLQSIVAGAVYPRGSDVGQRLLRDDATAAGHSVDGSNSAQGHRDAAAMLLVKLGRSPNERIHVSPKDDSRVLRRIDLALLPLMLAVYFLQALDKATLSYASIFGLIEDTKLVGDQFSWLGSIVFVAQLIMQLPLALALVKLPIGKFTGAMVLGWGLTLTAMTCATNFPQLMAARFFLGAFEASVGPSFVAITQMWWRRREQTMRIGSWYCMNGLTWVVSCGRLTLADRELMQYSSAALRHMDWPASLLPYVLTRYAALHFKLTSLIPTPDYISHIWSCNRRCSWRHVRVDAGLSHGSEVLERRR